MSPLTKQEFKAKAAPVIPYSPPTSSRVIHFDKQKGSPQYVVMGQGYCRAHAGIALLKVTDGPRYVWLIDVSGMLNLERLRGTVSQR